MELWISNGKHNEKNPIDDTFKEKPLDAIIIDTIKKYRKEIDASSSAEVVFSEAEEGELEKLAKEYQGLFLQPDKQESILGFLSNIMRPLFLSFIFLQPCHLYLEGLGGSSRLAISIKPPT